MLLSCALSATQRESFSRNGPQKKRLSMMPSRTLVVLMMLFNSAERFWAPVTFGSTFAQSCWAWVEPGPDFERLVGVPEVIEEHDRAEGAEHHHADLERIALALALFGGFPRGGG